MFAGNKTAYKSGCLLMKKIIIVLVLLLAAAWGGIYFFIPATLTVSNIATLPCSKDGASRTLQQKETWKRLWPGNTRLTLGAGLTPDYSFIYQNDTFRITRVLQNALSIAVSGAQPTIQTTLLTIPVTPDSLLLQWSYTTATGTNPVARIQQYRQAVETKKTIALVLNRVKEFLSKNENIYGITISQTSTADTFLVSTDKIINAYPSTNEIYSLVNKLQAYAASSNAAQTGNPMMNITQLTAQQYKLMVAIPTDKLLRENGDITYKRMVPGRFLTTTVTGGTGAVNNAYNQLQQYFQDYQRTSMAIPFQYLITDRTKERDTSRWITKLYFPVM